MTVITIGKAQDNDYIIDHPHSLTGHKLPENE